MDVDGDGDLDLAVLSLQGLHLIENTSAPRHFARVRLTATRSPAPALGAVVHLRAGGVTQQDYVRMTDGLLTVVARDLHFGLGDAAAVESLGVDWPSGAHEEWKDLPADRVLEVREGAAAVEARVVPRWPEESRARVVPPFSPELEADRLEGGKGRVVATGRPAVVHFWSPSCAPCREEWPQLVRLAGRFGAAVGFAGVSLEAKDLEAVRATVQEVQAQHPQYLANAALLASFFGGEGKAILPSTFVFDGAGKLRRAFLRPLAEEEVAALLESFGREGPFAIDYRLLAQACSDRRDYAQAAEWLQKAVAVQPRDPIQQVQLGVALGRAGRPEEAARAFAAATVLDPGDAVAFSNLGRARLAAGHPREAIAALQSALALQGENADTLLVLAVCGMAADDAALALSALDRALRARPDSPVLLVNKAKALRRLGRRDDARKSLEAALALDPGLEEAQRELLALAQEEREAKAPGVRQE